MNAVYIRIDGVELEKYIVTIVVARVTEENLPTPLQLGK
jgi:hypothetical protein